MQHCQIWYEGRFSGKPLLFGGKVSWFLAHFPNPLCHIMSMEASCHPFPFFQLEGTIDVLSLPAAES
jgi:hypothetical protein